MDAALKKLTIPERIQLAEELWESVSQDQSSVPLTEAQKSELDRRLALHEANLDTGKPSEEVLEEIRSRL